MNCADCKKPITDNAEYASTADKDKGFIGASTTAYRDFYPEIAEHILNNGKVTIEIKNIFD